VLVLEGVVQVEQFRVMQLVHDGDLALDGVLVERIRRVDELGDEASPGRLLDGSVYHAERAADNHMPTPSSVIARWRQNRCPPSPVVDGYIGPRTFPLKGDTQWHTRNFTFFRGEQV